MRKSLLMIVPLLVGVLLFSTCEEPTEPDTTPPSITITSSFSNTVFEIVIITVMAADDSGIEKVELWVDGVFTGISDNTEPYELDWNTLSYLDGTAHVIVIRAYDTSGNTADSVPITLTVDNSGASPSEVVLGVLYGDDIVTLLWTKNNDADFLSYSLYESETNDVESGNLIYETSEREDTTYTIAMPQPGNINYYWVVVSDTFGLNTNSEISTIAGSLLSFSIGDLDLSGDVFDNDDRYHLAIHNDAGEFLADTVIENESPYNLLPENSSNQITSKICVTLLIKSMGRGIHVVLSFNDIDIGSEFEMNRLNDPPSYESFQAFVSFENIPDNEKYLFGTSLHNYSGSYLEENYYFELTLNNMFDDVYLRFDYLENEPEYIWLNDFSPGEERSVDLNELSFNSMTKHTISFDHSINDYQVSISGDNYQFETIYDSYEDTLYISSVDVYVPGNYNSYEERTTSIYSNSDNGLVTNSQITYGDIPNSFTKIDADFEYISINSIEDFEIQTNGTYDFLESDWWISSQNFSLIFVFWSPTTNHFNSSILSWVSDKCPEVNLSAIDTWWNWTALFDYVGINGFHDWIENEGYFISGFDYRRNSRFFSPNTYKSNSLMSYPLFFLPHQDIPNNFPHR